MQPLLAIAAALSDESRLRALMAVRQQEICVCQIIELLGLAPSTVSKHLSILKNAGLVETRKDGRWIFYRIPENPTPAVTGALQWIDALAKSDARANTDKQTLQRILKEDPEVLCRRQMGGSKCCSSAPETPAAAKWRKAGPATSKRT